MTPQDVVNAVKAQFSTAVQDVQEFRGDWAIRVDRAALHDVCLFLRDRCAFAMLSDLAGVDYFGDELRFEVNYVLYSFTHRFWFRVKTRAPEDQPEVDSVVDVWATADWHEREAWDLLGIRFRGHPHLTRILMWEGYPHHPLRKDFPLAGLPADLPETAVGAGRVETAPMLGGPFVSSVGTQRAISREPRQYDTLAEQSDKLSKPTRQEDV